MFVLLILHALGTSVVAQADWPRFRGPTGEGTSTAKNLPTKWSATEGIAWKTPLPGPGASSPIVIGDHIYLTSYTGYKDNAGGGSLTELKRHLLCLDRKTGKVLWQKTVPAKQPEEDEGRNEHGFAASTPVADAERVYVFFGTSGVFAYSHDGQEVWQADVGQKAHGWGCAASPILDGENLIVNASVESSSLVALNKKTGKEVWRTPKINEAWNTPITVKTAAGATEIVVAMGQRIIGVDPKSGKELWTCAKPKENFWYMCPSWVSDGEIVYGIGGRSGPLGYAVRAGGRGEVTDTHLLWSGESGSNVSSPIIHQGHLYYMNEHGLAFCVEAKTGNVIYKERIPRGDQVYASALLADGKVYYFGRNGTCYVVAANPKFELIATNQLEQRGRINSSPAVVDGRILIRSDKFLYAIGK
jgi:outer membrane protein assembly factor BamB